MELLIGFWLMTAVVIFAAIKYKKAILLTVPFFFMIGYLVIQIILVPMPFWETVRFVFSLR
ncbi:hypothetical protein [Alkalicoccus chagannorensis]|uniref:hypothetical protein n=1 Tax=Alkalicoccus chagannorensis TaxID=427072 RepID=UPI0004278FE6|nr:hypothetical protein [Alkalicoccus chagannorensis]